MKDSPLRPSDNDVVRQVLNGDVNAYESLVTRYSALVGKIVRKHVPREDAEEAIQDTFVRAYLSLATFRGEGSFSQWVSSIAVRTCYDYWRKAYRSREVPMSALTEKHQAWLEEVISDRSDHLLQQEDSLKDAREVLDWALRRLSAEDRMVLELVYLEGRSVKETADLLGWSTANVKVRSFRSRRRLERFLGEMIQEGGRK